MQYSQVFIPRFQPLIFESHLAELNSQEETKPSSKRAELHIRQRALLNTLFWQELPLIENIPDGHVEIENCAIELNAFDIFPGNGLIRNEIDTKIAQH